jgi:putative copper export protein
MERRIAQLLAAAGAFFLVTLYFQIAALAARSRGMRLSYGQALSPTAIWRYVSTQGAMTGVQYGLWALGAVVLMLVWTRRFGAHLTAVTSSALAISLVSHQMTLLTTRSLTDAVGMLANHVHVIAVSVWIGGVAGLAALSRVRSKLSPAGGALWAQLWGRFSTVALIAVGCIVISGLYMAWTLVGSPAELLTTRFGNVLLVKVILVAAAVTIGGCHEFVLLPRMARARAEGDRHSTFGLALRTAPLLAAAEATLGAGALVAMTFLNGSARRQAGDAAATLSYNVIGLGVVLTVSLAASFVLTAKLAERLAAGAAGQPTSA